MATWKLKKGSTGLVKPELFKRSASYEKPPETGSPTIPGNRNPCVLVTTPEKSPKTIVSAWTRDIEIRSNTDARAKR
jgi:hypothetical protein